MYLKHDILSTASRESLSTYDYVLENFIQLLQQHLASIFTLLKKTWNV